MWHWEYVLTRIEAPQVCSALWTWGKCGHTCLIVCLIDTCRSLQRAFWRPQPEYAFLGFANVTFTSCNIDHWTESLFILPKDTHLQDSCLSLIRHHYFQRWVFTPFTNEQIFPEFCKKILSAGCASFFTPQWFYWFCTFSNWRYLTLEAWENLMMLFSTRQVPHRQLLLHQCVIVLLFRE